MSVNQWEWSLASADGLLTNEECALLLDADIFSSDDLLKNFPSSGPKVEGECMIHDDGSTSLYPPSPPEVKPCSSELATDLLHQLDNNCKQENIFSNWLEEKVELPIFDNIPQQVERAETVQYPALQHTEELLREFDTVYGVVELTHLTPPQSPPGPATQLLLSYAQQAQCVPLASPLPLPVPTALPLQEAWPIATDSELQLEELLRHRASQLPSPQASGDSTTTSPHSSPPSSPHSSADEDWCARPKPYSRGTDDRRSRKKEQNKNAATRYRQKKKAEIEVLLNEENSLRQRHSELGNKCSDLQREIRYLKGLMRDLFKAKGLIK